jgi:hypothetical protein
MYHRFFRNVTRKIILKANQKDAVVKAGFLNKYIMCNKIVKKLKELTIQSKIMKNNFQTIRMNLDYKLVIFCWESWFFNWNSRRLELVYTTQAMETYLNRLLKATFLSWRQLIQTNKSWKVYDKTLNKLVGESNMESISSPCSIEQLKENNNYQLEKKNHHRVGKIDIMSIRYPGGFLVSSDDDDDEEEDDEEEDLEKEKEKVGKKKSNALNHIPRDILSVIFKKIISKLLICVDRNKKMKSIFSAIILKRDYNILQRTLGTMKSLMIKIYNQKLKVAGRSLAKSDKEMYSRISTLKYENSRNKEEHVNIMHSIDVMSCDQAAKKIEIDSLNLQKQEVELSLQRSYNMYSNFLSEYNRNKNECQTIHNNITKHSNQNVNLKGETDYVENIKLLKHQSLEVSSQIRTLNNIIKENKSRMSEVETKMLHASSTALTQETFLDSEYSLYSQRLKRIDQEINFLLHQKNEADVVLISCQSILSQTTSNVESKVGW